MGGARASHPPHAACLLFLKSSLAPPWTFLTGQVARGCVADAPLPIGSCPMGGNPRRLCRICKGRDVSIDRVCPIRSHTVYTRWGVRSLARQARVDRGRSSSQSTVPKHAPRGRASSLGISGSGLRRYKSMRCVHAKSRLRPEGAQVVRIHTLGWLGTQWWMYTGRNRGHLGAEDVGDALTGEAYLR